MSVFTIPRNTILTGDALNRLRQLPDASIDSIVTSPPYFRLRDYGVDGQLGLEGHVDSWAAQLGIVLAECARVLVPTGTLWLNLGDAYSTHQREGAARKSLLLGPERLALHMVENGWILRNKIIWAKTNTIPSSVADRLSTRYEVIYLFARNPRYYFNLDTIREPHTTKPAKRRSATRPPNRADSTRPAWLGPNSDGDSGLVAMHAAGIVGHPLGKNPGDVWRMSVSNFRGAHFATYPEHLIDRMLRAGCPERRCQICRAPWAASTTRQRTTAPPRAGPTCQCDGPSEPGLVLDPFLGSGTTAVVAERLKRDWLGIELNPDFIALADERIGRGHDINETEKEVT